MAGKDNFEKDMDALMTAMLLKSILGGKEDIKIVPFKVEVAATPVSIDCHVEGNKRFLKDIEGGEEWFRETSELLEPIMKTQTTKFVELAKKKFGLDMKEAEPKSGITSFEDFLKSMLGGGQNDNP